MPGRRRRTSARRTREFLLRSTSADDKAEGEKILAALVAEDKPGVLAAADAWQRIDQYGRAADGRREGLQREPGGSGAPVPARGLARARQEDRRVRGRVREAPQGPRRPRARDELPGLHVGRPRREPAAGAGAHPQGRGSRAVERGLPRFARLGLLPPRQARQGRGEPHRRLGAEPGRRDRRGAPRRPLAEEGRPREGARELEARAHAQARARREGAPRREAPEDRRPSTRRSDGAAGSPVRCGLPVAVVAVVLFLEGGCGSGPSVRAPSDTPSRGTASSSLRGRRAPRAWDPSRRFKALFRAEVSPKVGAIGRGYLSVWWDGASRSLEWRTSAPIAGAGRGGLLRMKGARADARRRDGAAPPLSARTVVRRPHRLHPRDRRTLPSVLRGRPRRSGDGSSRCASRTARSSQLQPGDGVRGASRRTARTGARSSTSRATARGPPAKRSRRRERARARAVRSTAFAKMNRTLRVLGKRPDGFHELDTVFQTVDLRDTQFFLEGEEGGGRRGALAHHRGRGHCRRTTPISSCARRARPREEFAASRRARASTFLRRSLSAAGSAEAARTRRRPSWALSALWKLRRRPADLQALAASLGSDVPFFLLGGRARGAGGGRSVAPLPDGPEEWLLLVFPPFSLSTTEVYGRLEVPRLDGKSFCH